MERKGRERGEEGERGAGQLVGWVKLAAAAGGGGEGSTDGPTEWRLCETRIWDLGFGIRDVGFGIRDVRFGIWDSGFGRREFESRGAITRWGKWRTISSPSSSVSHPLSTTQRRLDTVPSGRLKTCGDGIVGVRGTATRVPSKRSTHAACTSLHHVASHDTSRHRMKPTSMRSAGPGRSTVPSGSSNTNDPMNEWPENRAICGLWFWIAARASARVAAGSMKTYGEGTCDEAASDMQGHVAGYKANHAARSHGKGCGI